MKKKEKKLLKKFEKRLKDWQDEQSEDFGIKKK